MHQCDRYIDADTPDTNTSSSLEPSHLGRIIINYHDTNIDVDKTTISWLYYPVHNSPCAKSNYYELGLYSRTGSGDLQYLNSLDSMEESITFDCPNLISPNNETMIYFNITVLSNNNDSCATTEYLQTLSGQGNHNKHRHVCLCMCWEILCCDNYVQLLSFSPIYPSFIPLP